MVCHRMCSSLVLYLGLTSLLTFFSVVSGWSLITQFSSSINIMDVFHTFSIVTDNQWKRE